MSLQLSDDADLRCQVEDIEDFNINTRILTTEQQSSRTDNALPLRIEHTWICETQPFRPSLFIPTSSIDEYRMDPASTQVSAYSKDEFLSVKDGASNENCQFLSILHDSGFFPCPAIQSDGFNPMTSLSAENSDPFYADWPYWDHNISEALKVSK